MMITVKQFLEERNFPSSKDIEYLLIKFAKLHVQKALKQASKNVELKLSKFTNDEWYIDKNSILNAYPLENIK